MRDEQKLKEATHIIVQQGGETQIGNNDRLFVVEAKDSITGYALEKEPRRGEKKTKKVKVRGKIWSGRK